MLVGEKERVGSALVVEPLRGMVWGELMALSVMRRPAFAAPGQLGLKTTETVQLLPESSIPVQLLLASLKSDPPWPEKVKGANDKELLLVLVMVTTCSREVLSRLVGGKSRLAGVMAGEPAAEAMQEGAPSELRAALERRATDAFGPRRINLAG